MEKTKFFTDTEMDLLRYEIANGHVNVNKHPTADIYIYNYTVKTQYDWHWNDITIKCRGLILDGEGYLVAKGFDKFFTVDQLKDAGQESLIPKNESFRIYDKVDGSLGVMYFIGEEPMPYIATRGSFVSEMADVANKWLQDQYAHIVFYPEYTYLFEIIYPENRIVVDYGDERKLVLLAVIRNNTLEEMDIYSEEFDYIEEQGLERAESFMGNWSNIMDKYQGDKSKEGFVVHFLESNYRVKMKLDWYKDTAYIMQHFSKKSVWRLVRDGSQIEDIIKDMDDEFYPMVQGYYDELMEEYHKIWLAHNELYILILNKMKERFSQKDFAIKAKEMCGKEYNFSYIMSMHNKKEIFSIIWKSIEPKTLDNQI